MALQNTSIRSMTGFASVEGDWGENRIRMEARSLNHRFLDIKLRLPRDFSGIDFQLRAEIQNRFSRGSIEFKIEYVGEKKVDDRALTPNLSIAAHYYECLLSIKKMLGLDGKVQISDLMNFPDIINKSHMSSGSTDPSMIWENLKPQVVKTLDQLEEMRSHEGKSLSDVLKKGIDQLKGSASSLKNRRLECQKEYQSRILDRVRQAFETYSSQDQELDGPTLQTRTSQELAIILDRTDIEEEISRFENHLKHFEKTLNTGGPTGRKLDFILQELHREINTMANKAQDFPMSEEAVKVKVGIEQLREQVMNIE